MDVQHETSFKGEKEFQTLFDQGSADQNDYQTPAWIIDALPEFDLDPCSSEFQQKQIAPVTYTKKDDGLSKEWAGRVFCNPPYGNATGDWLKRCADHGKAIALTFARTDTAMFHEQVFLRASALLFIRGRLKFYSTRRMSDKGGSGAPSVLIAYGEEMAELLEKCDIPGAFVRLNRKGGPIGPS